MQPFATMAETCCCGARTEMSAPLPSTLWTWVEDFRKAHEACRRPVGGTT